MVQGIFTGNSIAGAPVHNDGTSQMKGRKYIILHKLYDFQIIDWIFKTIKLYIPSTNYDYENLKLFLTALKYNATI